MLTIKQLRDDKAEAIRRLAKKGVDAEPIIARIEELDDRRKAINSNSTTALPSKTEQQNRLAP